MIKTALLNALLYFREIASSEQSALDQKDRKPENLSY